jgi:crossover junction endodeoxyribonuclease RusA
MSASVTVSLAYPPSANRLWRSVRGHVVRSAEYAAWLAAASWTVKMAVTKTFDRKGVPGPYGLYVQVCPPDNRARDLDNLLKPISDALVHGGAVIDDKLCQMIEIAWKPDLWPAVSVTVMETKLRIPAAVKPSRRRKSESSPSRTGVEAEDASSGRHLFAAPVRPGPSRRQSDKGAKNGN